MMTRGALIFLMITLLCEPAGALSLPLQGYYRPERYMPVVIIGGDAAVEFTIGTDLPTMLIPPPRAPVTAPVLMPSGAERQLAWRAGDAARPSIPLQPLRDDQRLIGVTSPAGASAAAGAFADGEAVVVRLDPVRPLPGPAIAWDALDAIVLDSWPGGIDPAAVPQLLAMGVTIAVMSAEAPDEQWPWQPQGELFVLRPRLAGPTGAAFDERVYLPTQGWVATHEPAMRQLVLWAGVLLALLAAATSLWRSRLNLAAMALLVIVAVLLIELYRRGTSPAAERTALISVPADPLMQRDAWTWRKMLRRGQLRLDAAELSYPIFASPSHLRVAAPVLRCDGDGTPREFVVTLDRDASVALLRRAVTRSRDDEVATREDVSPLVVEMARRVYGREGLSVRGATGDSVVLEWDE